MNRLPTNDEVRAQKGRSAEGDHLRDLAKSIQKRAEIEITELLERAKIEDAKTPRSHCTCGAEMLSWPGVGLSNWGDWKCSRCAAAWCQDCGAQIGLAGTCEAYEETKRCD